MWAILSVEIPLNRNEKMTETKPTYQREGSVSNAHVGREFEQRVFNCFKKEIPDLRLNFPMEIGHSQKKLHSFDMGSESKKVMIECKSHTWTKSNNVPSAKLTTWDQAMLYFHLSPTAYRKMFIVLKDDNKQTHESLLSYYLRLHAHLIPDGVELWEMDESKLVKVKEC